MDIHKIFKFDWKPGRLKYNFFKGNLSDVLSISPD